MLAICAFTVAGHDSPAAVAEWTVGCSQRTLAVLGGRRDPWAQRIRAPSARTFARVFTGLDAGAFNAAFYGYLGSLPGERRGIRTAPAIGIDWPHAAQILRIRRDSGPSRGPWTHKEFAYGITSLPADLAGPGHLAFYARKHWAIENREHRASETLRRSTTPRPRCGPGPRACWAWRQQLSC